MRLIVFSLVLSGAAAGAGSFDIAREYSHRIWRVQDGLPANRIQAISQTPDGYLWIGTSGGLVRFDGVRFSLFDRSSTPELKDDSILALCPSADGSLWVGTEGGWLLRYRNGSFETVNAGNGLANGFVRALYEDPRGTLWIGTDRGFFKLRGGKIERLDNQGEIPVTAITSIAGDREGRIWAAAGIGLLMVEGGALHRVMPENEILKGIRGVREARDGSLWLLTLKGLWRFQKGALIERRELNQFMPLALTEDQEGNVWIGTLGRGLIRLGPGGADAFRGAGMLPDNTVVSAFEDREGNLWMGTQDGLLRLSRTPVRMLTGKEGLADDNISTIYEDADKSLWLVSITGQVYRYANGRVVPFRLPESAAGLRIRQVYRDRKGTLWMGTGDNGLIRWRDGKLTVLTTEDGLRNNSIRQIEEDRRGDLWIALGSGLSRWDGRQFHNYYLEDGLAYGSVRVLLEDRNGDLLVGTEGGLNRIHDGKFVRDPVFARLDGERVWSLHEDSDGALWVGTRGGGLFRIKNGGVGRITVLDGLLSNAIYGVLEDGAGNLWMSTPAGVFSAPRRELDRVADGHPGAVAIVPYGTADGLESAQMNGGLGSSGTRTSSGELWFPSVKGVARIDPTQVRLSHPSPVLIESVTADDKAIPLSGEIRIPAGHGKLLIEYTAASLLSPERITFQYRLEGFEDSWTAASNHRAAYYTNLPPGQYRFHVIARDSATPLQVSEAVIPLVWQPHFYQTAWLYGLGGTLVGLCGWAALRFYARQTKARYDLLLAERTRLAREMHDTVIQGCVGVSTLLEAASAFQQSNAARSKELVDQARVQVRLTLDEAREAVWDLRRDHIEGDITGTLHDLARQLTTENGIPIEVEFVGSPPAIQQQTLRSILLVAREAIRNAAHHGLPKQIRIQMSFETEEVRLEVMDDGRGFAPAAEPEDANGHYGIVGMRERVEQLGGSFLVRSSPGQGTSVVVRLPVGAG